MKLYRLQNAIGALCLLLSSLSQAQTCSLEEVSANNYHLRVLERDIQVIGWTHLNPLNGDDFLMHTLTNVSEAQEQSCADIEQKFDQVISHYSQNISNSQSALDALVSASENFQIDKLGSEHSYHTQQEVNLVLDTYIELFNSIKAQCEFDSKIDQLELLIPGPLSVYQRRYNAEAEIEGVESHYLKNKNLAGVEEFVSSRPKWSIYSDEVIEAVEALEIDFNENDIQIILDMVQDPLLELRLEEHLVVVHRFFATSRARSEAMALNVFNRSGNYAVLIGEDHAKDIADSLYRRCLERN